MKKGFTLIELLAVIVILAIIATIATPIVLSIIEDTKNSSTLRNAEYYLEAVQQSIARKSLNMGKNYKPNTCVIQLDGNLICDEEVEVIVEVKGNKPSGGTITFDKGKVNDITINIENKVVTKNEQDEFVVTQSPIILKPGLYDADDNLVASWDELVNAYGMDVQKNYTYSTYNKDDAAPRNVLKQFPTGTKLIVDNRVTAIGSYTFYGCTSLTSITIPDSVTAIGYSAFQNCSSLTNLAMHDGMTQIGEYAFRFCTSLTNVTIPNSISTISHAAFADCTSLTSVIIPDSVNTIAAWAFSDCTSLTSVTIPDSVTVIGSNAFSGSSKLTSVTFNNPNGWSAGTTTLSSDDLNNTTTAATYLKSTYNSIAWTRTP